MKGNKTIIVTGGHGYIGNFLVKTLLKSNFKVVCVDQKKGNILNKKAIYYKSSIKNFFKDRNIDNIFSIIHLAAESRNSVSLKKPNSVTKKNINDTLTILESIRNSKKKPSLFFSSTKQIEIDKKNNFLSPYSISKKTCEDLIKFYSYKFKIKSCILRFSDVYSYTNNPKKKALSSIIFKLKINKNITIVDKKHYFNFVHIDTICTGIVKLLKKNLALYQEVNFYQKQKVYITKLVRMLKKITNSKSQIIFKKNQHKKSLVQKSTNSYNIAKTIYGKTNIIHNLNKIIKDFN
ncbi:MAG: hypothetical protein CBC24_03505 [Candidatus Pelagibacter sp. TMED64]|nr:hypothetical protein [Candidatus Pelagibacter sp.]OUU66287.1 MAG: hypothetical protein CBC24_03505 [Candidatus Pelagibacter sp. TMED64]